MGEKDPGQDAGRGQASAIGTPSAELSLGRVASPQSPPPFHLARGQYPDFGETDKSSWSGDREM